MTAQIHERLILDGVETSMAFCPPLSEGHSGICEAGSDEGARDISDLILSSSACWRGYQGTWEIKDGRFYLVGLRGRFKLREGKPVLADWVSGVLRVPKGKMLQYVHMGFCSVYEQELQIKIENGEVIKTSAIDNRRKKRARWRPGWKNLPGGKNRFP